MTSLTWLRMQLMEKQVGMRFRLNIQNLSNKKRSLSNPKKILKITIPIKIKIYQSQYLTNLKIEICDGIIWYYLSNIKIYPYWINNAFNITPYESYYIQITSPWCATLISCLMTISIIWLRETVSFFAGLLSCKQI